jgi:hypothetical protein
MARQGPFRDPSRRTTDADSHFVVPEIDTFAKIEGGRIAEPYHLSIATDQLRSEFVRRKHERANSLFEWRSGRGAAVGAKRTLPSDSQLQETRLDRPAALSILHHPGDQEQNSRRRSSGGSGDDGLDRPRSSRCTTDHIFSIRIFARPVLPIKSLSHDSYPHSPRTGLFR